MRYTAWLCKGARHARVTSAPSQSGCFHMCPPSMVLRRSYTALSWIPPLAAAGRTFTACVRATDAMALAAGVSSTS